MKRIMSAIFAAVMSMGTVAYADDTSVSVSIKGWYNSWEEKYQGETIKSDDPVFMVGPSVNVRSGNWFGGITYLTSTSGDYTFSDIIFQGDILEIERKDLDIIVGYMLSPRFGVFAGYKSIEAPAKYSYGGSSYDYDALKLTGPGIGILGNYPFEGINASLYGSLALMSLDYEWGDVADDVSGASLEIGVNYAFTENLSGNVGIKSQSFSGSEDAEDTFSGPTFGVNYTF